MQLMVPYSHFRRQHLKRRANLERKGRGGSIRTIANPRPPTTMLVWQAGREIATSRTASVVVVVITRSMRGLVKKIQGVG
jgi:hypothetical protein